MEARYDVNQFGVTDFHFVCARYILKVTYAESFNMLLMHFQIIFKMTLLQELLFAFNVKHLLLTITVYLSWINSGFLMGRTSSTIELSHL